MAGRGVAPPAAIPGRGVPINPAAGRGAPMQVCMYIYIYIYMYVCMYIYICIYIYISDSQLWSIAVALAVGDWHEFKFAILHKVSL